MADQTRVLFALAGVLARVQPERLARAFGAGGRAGMPVPDAHELLASDRTRAYQAGQLSPEQFLRGLAQSFGWDRAPFEKLAEAWRGTLAPRADLEALAVAVVDAGHPAYLVASSDPLQFEHLRPQLKVLTRFSGVFLSYEAGCVAPDPAFFAAALDRLRLRAASCCYLDASPAAVEAAKEVGLPAMVVGEDVAAVRAWLRRWDVKV